jgi:hypothetical protein
MEKALQNLVQVLKTDVLSWRNGSEESFWRSSFEVVQSMPGASRKFRSIANQHDREQLQDILAEIKYAVIFAELGFQVEIEPLMSEKEKANPDLRISRDGDSSVVEVKRFRPSDDLAPKLLSIDDVSELGVLSEFGDPKRDWQKIFDEIEHKFRQAGADGIIAIWNNAGRLSPEEVESAAHAHLLRGSSRRSSFVLFKSDCDENFHCFKLRYRALSYQDKWMAEFSGVEPKELLFRPYYRRGFQQV